MIPLQIVSKDLPVTDSMRSAIEKYVGKLELFYDRIERCEVSISYPNRRHRKGNIYHVRLHIHVPKRDIIINRKQAASGGHEDLLVAMRDAFHAADRKLEDHVRRLRGDVKTHQPPSHGRVARIFPLDGYGFIHSESGEEIYFHERSVLNGAFGKLSVGTEVRYAREQGIDGPQVSSMAIVGKEAQHVFHRETERSA